MKPFRIDRRFILRGMGGIGIALPLLDVMEPVRRAFGQTATAAPRRFVAMFNANGTIYNNWKPTGSGTSFTLSPILMPLSAHQSNLVIIDGLIDKAATVSGDDHQKGMTTNLTGIEALPGPAGGTAVGLSSGMSVDQAIANQIGKSSAFKSLELGIQTLPNGDALHYMAYAGSGQALPAQDDPNAVYKRIFGSFTAPSGSGTVVTTTGSGGAGGSSSTTGGTTAMTLLNQRKSVLDAALDSYNSLLPKVSANDKLKLQAHSDQIRDLENRLVSMNTSGSTGSGTGAGGSSGSTGGGTTTGPSAIASCVKPGTPASVSFKQTSAIPAVAQLHMDLLVMAMACDLTRVGTVQFGYEACDPVMSFADSSITRGHHTISHDDDSNAQSMTQLTNINIWFAKQFAYLIAAMKKIPEGGGTMLDNSLLIWTNGLAKGNVHSHSPMPIVTAGGAGGSIKTGRFLTFSKTNTNNFLVSCLNAMGVQATTFGNAAYSSGALSGFVS